nr:hypothetical protein [Gemmatimonadota bacterium]
MLSKRWSVCAAAALLYGGVAAAQQPGTLLLGGFGQYTIFDGSLKTGGTTGAGITGNKFGYGGRIGAFIAPNWDLEAEAAYTEAPTAGAPIKYGPIAARLVYGIPVYGRSSILIGAGGVLSPYHNDVIGTGNYYTYHYGVSGDLGLRIMLGDAVALRGDAIADYMPSSPSTKNYRFQAGLEVMPDFASLMGDGATAPAHFDWWDDQPQPLPGTLEIKAFGSWNHYDSKLNFSTGFSDNKGYGGGAGVFLTRNWEVEGDGSYVNPKTVAAHPQGAGIPYDNGNFSLRLNYNIPVFARSQFIIGAGAVRSSFHRSDNAGAPYASYSFGPEGLVGFRLGLANRIALRVDGLVDYPLGDFKTYNYSARAGLSFMVGGASRTM